MATAWHRLPGTVARFVADLVADEMSRLRPGDAPLPPPPWAPDLPLHEDGLGLDSLERLSVAAALNEALHLHESGLEDLLLARTRVGDWVELATRSLAAFDEQLTFRTSGSTGDAKPCTHTLARLVQEVDHLATCVRGTRRVLAAVPAHHIYGFLFTVLLPACLSCNAVLDVRRHTPQALAGLLEPGDLLVSHPAHWALVARHAGTLPPGVQGVTSTAPCPDTLATALLDLGLQRLLQVYGSSETAGIATREAAGAPFELMPFWSADPADPARLLRTLPDGGTCTQAIGDRLVWTGEGRFNVGGRLDGAVQVGGINVFPAQVREVVLSHPDVAEAAVRLMAPAEGSRLKAFVVPRPGVDPAVLRDALSRWCESRLPAPARPRAWTLGDRLPRNGLGKAADWPLGQPTPVTVEPG